MLIDLCANPKSPWICIMYHNSDARLPFELVKVNWISSMRLNWLKRTTRHFKWFFLHLLRIQKKSFLFVQQLKSVISKSFVWFVAVNHVFTLIFFANDSKVFASESFLFNAGRVDCQRRISNYIFRWAILHDNKQHHHSFCTVCFFCLVHDQAHVTIRVHISYFDCDALSNTKND